MKSFVKYKPDHILQLLISTAIMFQLTCFFNILYNFHKLFFYSFKILKGGLGGVGSG